MHGDDLSLRKRYLFGGGGLVVVMMEAGESRSESRSLGSSRGPRC